MRSPDGHDRELVRGLLFTEGVVVDAEAQLGFAEVSDPENGALARVDVTVGAEFVRVPVTGRRNQLATSSCGICGTRDPADLEIFGDPLKVGGDLRLAPDVVSGMLESMGAAQECFAATGGCHGAGAYTGEGAELVVREDIGRHNAVDKVIGWLLEHDRLGDTAVLTVSGRVSYEIVAKVYRSQIPILAAVSAPSSMAVETAEAFGITLIGFCREDRLTVYSHRERIVCGEGAE
jgi:FdhD protein